MQNIKIAALNKIFSDKNSAYYIVSTYEKNNGNKVTGKSQYFSDGSCIWIFPDKVVSADCFRVFGENQDNSENKPNLKIMTDYYTENFPYHHYKPVVSVEKGINFCTYKNGKKETVTKTKAYRLYNGNNSVIVQSVYFDSFTPDCKFYVYEHVDNIPVPVLVYGKRQLIGLIMPMVQNSVNKFETL